MSSIVGIRFRAGGKILEFDTGGLDLTLRQAVVVETQHGHIVGAVAIPPRGRTPDDQHSVSGVVKRFATPEDMRRKRENEGREEEALKICMERVNARHLPMKLISADFNLDGALVTIDFASETRVDFRDLVRDVASAIHARVIFHQVGVRDHARALGTLGHCGQQLCCARFLSTLDPVSMKMAKDQSLSINPSKFSGVCGKLMCCLRFEHETYQEILAEMPHLGDVLDTERGQAKVTDINPMTGAVIARLQDGTFLELTTCGDNGHADQCGGCRLRCQTEPASLD